MSKKRNPSATTARTSSQLVSVIVGLWCLFTDLLRAAASPSVYFFLLESPIEQNNRATAIWPVTSAILLQSRRWKHSILFWCFNESHVGPGGFVMPSSILSCITSGKFQVRFRYPANSRSITAPCVVYTRWRNPEYWHQESEFLCADVGLNPTFQHAVDRNDILELNGVLKWTTFFPNPAWMCVVFFVLASARAVCGDLSQPKGSKYSSTYPIYSQNYGS